MRKKLWNRESPASFTPAKSMVAPFWCSRVKAADSRASVRDTERRRTDSGSNVAPGVAGEVAEEPQPGERASSNIPRASQLWTDLTGTTQQRRARGQEPYFGRH